MKSNKTIDFIKELQVGDIIVKDGVFLKESEQSGCYLRNLPILLKVFDIKESTEEISEFKNVSKDYKYSRIPVKSEYTNIITVKTLVISTQEIIEENKCLIIKPIEQVFIHWDNDVKLIEDWLKQSEIFLNTYDLIIRPQQINHSLYY